MNSRTLDIGKACRLILLCFGKNLLCLLMNGVSENTPINMGRMYYIMV